MLHRALGLTDEEFERIGVLLGRAPNDFELGVFSLLWSEHCAYKHSAPLLARFPTDGPGVLQGPGENAGVVDLGEGEAVAFKVESHNHPSAVEPFQGAATGVGGILRDIVAMGARPVALLDGLRFGRPGFAFERAVSGIGHYGNCLAADELIVFRNSGRVSQTTIGELAEERASGGGASDWTLPPKKLFEVLSIDPRSHEPVWQEVTRIFKRTETRLLRVKTALGRTLTITPDHPMVVCEDGKLRERPASALRPGDRLPVLSALPPGDPYTEIDLIDALDEPSVVILPSTWTPSKALRKALLRVIPRADARHYWLRRRELPVEAFKAVESDVGVARYELRLRLAGPRSTRVPAVLPINEDTARLIGYYLSEGCCSRSGSTYRIIWTFGRNSRDSRYVDDVTKILEDLGLRHRVEVRGSTVAIIVSSRLLGRVLLEKLECGAHSHEKQIPPILLSASQRLHRELLKGIFRGDGSVQFPRRGSRVKISHSTTSKPLHEQLVLVLQSMGVFPSCYTRPAGFGEIQGRSVRNRPAYQVELYGYPVAAEAASWFAADDAEAILARARSTRESPYALPRVRRESAYLASLAVIDVEAIDGRAPVYDFEVPGTHLFVTTGGIVTHNCVGVPTVGGDTVFDDAYALNPLVNAMCVGLLPAERVTRSGTTRPGDLVVLFGATTGRDGIGGASVLASHELSDEDEDKRPTVQIGDPFTGKKLIEASLELVEAGLVRSFQDLGAAGLASALAETAGRGGVGIDLYLDRVPLRETDLAPVEIMLSESQERMVLSAPADHLDAVSAICRKWELDHAVIGEITGSGELRAYYEGALIGVIPAALLAEEAPRYRVETRPRKLAAPIAHRPIHPEADELLDLLRSPNIRSRAPVYRRYDHLVGSRTVRRPGLDAAVLRLRPSLRGLAVSLDGAGSLAALDPRAGGSLAVLEAARNVACAGGRPLAVTDCLNFGNPEKPEISWELAETVEGMALACEALKIPVVSGNVSLYNETDGRAIPPTPVVGCVGLVADVRAVPGKWRKGDVVFAVGSPELRLDGSEYQARFLGGAAGRPSRPNLALEAALVSFLWRAAPRLTLAHDAAEGGLAVALAEAALWSGVGARLDLEEDAATWFGEGGGQAVVSVSPDDLSVLDAVPHMRLGVVGGDEMLGVPIDDLASAYGAF